MGVEEDRGGLLAIASTSTDLLPIVEQRLGHRVVNDEALSEERGVG